MGLKAHDDLASELARLRQWVDAAQEFGRLSLWERDIRDGSGRWDRHIFSLYGLPPSDVAPHYEATLQHLHPDDRDRLRDSFRGSWGRPGRHETRFRIVRADGRVVHVHSIWQVPAEGHQVVGVLIDDTESLAQARAHEAARTQLGLVSQMVGVSFWRTDLQSQRVHRIDDGWKGDWGDPGEHGMPLAELRQQVHPDDRDVLERASQRAIEGAEAPMAEARYRAPDGSYRTVLTRRVLQRDAEGRPASLLGVGVDITDQIRAREHLSELLERQDMIVDVTGIGVWRWWPGTRQVEWNDPLRRIYGVPLDAPLPEADADGVAPFVLPADRENVRHQLRRVQSPDAPRVETTYRIRRPDGEIRTLVGRARRLPGSTRSITGIVLDVTDLQRAEAALRDQAAAVEAARVKGEFLSRVSHELRTPLNAVLGFTALLMADAREPLTEGQRSQLQHVRDAGLHLLGLVDDLLDIGRDGPVHDAGREPSCDLSAIVEQAVAWHADRASAAGVQVCVSGSCPRAWGDADVWSQVLSRLVSNAIKFNRRGGLVQITLRFTADPAWAELEVRDSGIGMSPAQRARLFEPFNRLGAERMGIAGTGLGLAIVRSNVHALGGSMTVDSLPGHGTTVTVRVPRAPDADAEGVAEAPAASGDAPRPAPVADPSTRVADVLYVEDNKVNALLVREVLARRSNLRVHVAGTVAEGIASLQRLHPALLLVDMHLPDGDGYAVLEHAQRHGPRPTAGCVALSADAMPQEIERALAAGFDAYWPKPIDVGRFLNDVDRLLPPSA